MWGVHSTALARDRAVVVGMPGRRGGWYIYWPGVMRGGVAHRGCMVVVALSLAGTTTARAQVPAPAGRVEGPASPGTAQIATEPPRRARRPPVDPATRELRQARGILAGSIVLTGLCGVGFGLATYSAIDRWERLTGASGDRAVAAVGVMFVCTVVSIGGIAMGASRLRTIKRSGRVAWAGGLGLRF